MPFPFLFLAVSLALGILLSTLFSFSFYTSLLVLAASLFIAWLFYLLNKLKLSFFFILLSTLLLGSSLTCLHQKNFENNSLRKLEYNDYADFYGKLYKSPSRGQERDFLFLRVEKVRYKNKEEKIRGNLRVSIPHSKEFPEPLALFTHDRIKVSARLLSYKGSRNFKIPSLTSYLKKQKIHKRAFSKSPLLVEKIDEERNYSPFRFISVFRRKLQQKIEEYFPSSSPDSISAQGAVLEALLLGERGRIAPSISTALQKTGLYHLFAISGAHIAIISFLLFSVFKLLRFPSRLSYILLMVFLLLYALIVEGRPSVIRATVMALAFLLGKLIWKNVNLLNTISIAAFFLLLVNPFNLFDLGFQLTFAATFCIILFFPRIIKFFPNLPLRISEIMVLSLTAQLGVLPFVAYSFNRVTFSSLILNYAALPLVGIIMACGYIFLLLSFVASFLAQLLAKAIHFIINLFLSLTHLTDYSSFLSYRIPTPHLVTIIGYFFFLFLFLLPPKIKKQRFIFFLCFLIFLIILITYPFPSSSENLKCTFIDVGQGDSILVEFPGQKKMLIDGGGLPRSSFDIGERIVSPFLWSKGIKKIHYLVLTHAHPDHLNGLKAIARNFRIGQFWEASIPSENESYRELKDSLQPEVTQKRVFSGYILQEGDVNVKALHPKKGNYFFDSNENNQSLVLLITYGRISLLLPGDIEGDAEREILESHRDIKSQLLKSPHHGSNSSSGEDFLDKVAPEIVVISVGEGNRYGFPDQNVITRYKKIGAKIFRTDLHGAVEVSSDGKSLSVRTSVK